MFFVSWACVFVLVCQCSYYFSCSCRTAQTFFFSSPLLRLHVVVCAQKSERVCHACLSSCACLPMHTQGFTWHQSESSGTVISLPTACCWLKPGVLHPPLPFSFLPPSYLLSPAFLSFAHPPHSPTHHHTYTPTLPPTTLLLLLPSIPESHHSAVLPLPAAKKGPISSSAESYKLHSFFLSLHFYSFVSLFSLFTHTS